MKLKRILLLALFCAMAATDAGAQTRSARCSSWARDQMRVTRSTPQPGRGQTRGRISNSAAGNIRSGGTAGTRLGQRHRSYQFFYNQCMSRR